MKDEVTQIIILIREEIIFVNDLIKVNKDRIPTPNIFVDFRDNIFV